MNTRSRRFDFLIPLALLLVSCGKDEPPPGTQPPRPQFGQVRWSSFPVDFRVADSVLSSPDRSHDLRTAVAFWERHAGKKLFNIAGDWKGPGLPYSGSANAPSAISANALIFDHSGALEDNIAGLTSLRVDGSTIQGAVMMLDPEVPLCSGICASETGSTSLRRLIAHELGHFLGLGHSTDPTNVMYPVILPGGTLRDRTVDEDTLRRLTQ